MNKDQTLTDDREKAMAVVRGYLSYRSNGIGLNEITYLLTIKVSGFIFLQWINEYHKPLKKGFKLPIGMPIIRP